MSCKATRGLLISDEEVPFSSLILSGQKTIETRDYFNPWLEKVANTQERIALIRCGTNKGLKAYATCMIGTPYVVSNFNTYYGLRHKHCVPMGSKYYWKGKSKYFYPLLDVQPLDKEIEVLSHSPIIGILK